MELFVTKGEKKKAVRAGAGSTLPGSRAPERAAPPPPRPPHTQNTRASSLGTWHAARAVKCAEMCRCADVQ